MSTYLDDLKKKNPKLAADYALVGDQDSVCLRNMIKALSFLGALNTPEEDARLAAAKRILRARKAG